MQDENISNGTPYVLNFDPRMISTPQTLKSYNAGLILAKLFGNKSMTVLRFDKERFLIKI